MSTQRERWLSPSVAILVLIAFWIGLLASLRGTSQTADEGMHALRGFTYWRFNDYRLNPANGNLPQRLIALPLLFGNYKFPPVSDTGWRTCQGWQLAREWFYESGNDADAMTRRGRAANGLLAVALGFLVWAWSRHLFGPRGGMLSLLLYVFSPTVLANGVLMTSDIAAALFFFAATWAWWRMLQQPTPARIIVSTLAMAGLFVSKMSCVVIFPVALTLLALRLVQGTPVSFRRSESSGIRSRATQLAIFSAIAIGHILVVLLVIWSFYGFRYSAFSPAMPGGAWTDETWELLLEKPPPISTLKQLGLNSEQEKKKNEIFTREEADPERWSTAALKALDAVRYETLTQEQQIRFDELLARPPPKLIARIFETLRQHHVLPEAYLYAFAHAWHGSNERPAFLNGHFSRSGWHTFFPYTFLVKTPITVFVVIGFAVAALFARVRAKRLDPSGEKRVVFQTAPLWALFLFYWTAAITSHLNIGHRHILATYPPLFVLCGAAAIWLQPHAGPRDSSARRVSALILSLALLLLVFEVVYRFPHYIAYFNGIVRPEKAYRHLVDSSLDWGQDLPGVRSYIETRHPPTPAYLAYFGSASPSYYQIPAIQIYSGSESYRPPPLLVLPLPQNAEDEALRNFLRSQPEYDDTVIGRAENGGQTYGILMMRPPLLCLGAGTYFISATLMQPVSQLGCGVGGDWNEQLEKEYQAARKIVGPLLSDEASTRSTALNEISPQTAAESIIKYECLAFNRLAAFLRKREPDDNIGFSILVYHLSPDDIARALDGPPVDFERTLPD